MSRLSAFALPVLFCLPALAQEPAAPAAKPLRILLTYGGHGFQQEPFFAMFDNLPGIQYTKAELPRAADEFLKPDFADRYDAVVRYDMIPILAPKHCEALAKLVKQGVGLVSLHHNAGAHRTWDEYENMIGGRYLFAKREIEGKEYPPSGFAHGQTLKVHVEDSDHPVTRGVTDFEIVDEAYSGLYVLPDVHVLLRTDHPKCNGELAWTRSYGDGRVVYLLLGHDNVAWSNPVYPKLVAQALEWVARKGER